MRPTSPQTSFPSESAVSLVEVEETPVDSIALALQLQQAPKCHGFVAERSTSKTQNTKRNIKRMHLAESAKRDEKSKASMGT